MFLFSFDFSSLDWISWRESPMLLLKIRSITLISHPTSQTSHSDCYKHSSFVNENFLQSHGEWSPPRFYMHCSTFGIKEPLENTLRRQVHRIAVHSNSRAQICAFSPRLEFMGISLSETRFVTKSEFSRYWGTDWLKAFETPTDQPIYPLTLFREPFFWPQIR